MPPRKGFLTPKIGLFLIGVLVLGLTALTPFISSFSISTNSLPESHALLEYFVAYIGICLFFICLRRFHLQRTKDFLFWGLGFLTFVLLQIFQSLAYPGFHDFTWMRGSDNIGIAFDITARIAFSIYFLIGIVNIKKRLVQPSFSNILLIYLNAVAFVLFLVVTYFNVLPEILYVNGAPTAVKKGLEIFSAGLILAAAILLIRRIYRENQTIYFWFIVACVLGVFTNIYLGLWQNTSDVYFAVGHGFKILFFTSFLVGIFADHIRFFKIEAELRESLEKSKEDLEKSEKTFRQLVEKMGDGFVVTDKRGILIFSNHAFATMLQYENETLVGRHISTFFYGSHYDDSEFESLHKSEKQAGKFEVEMLTKSGRKIPVLIHAVPIIESDGDYAGIQAVVTNLTERKEIERQLENLVKEKTQNIEIFKQCIENSTDGILIISLTGKIVYLNRAFEAITGFTKRELVKQDTTALIYDQDSEDVHQRIWKTVKNGKIWRGDFYTKKKDGTGFIGDVSVVPIHEENGRAINYLWIEKDITRKKMLERNLERYAEQLTNKTSELEAAKSYYETLISGMSDILIVVDNSGRCTFLNDYGRKRLKFRAEELTEESLPVFFDDLKRLEKEYGSALRVEIKDFESPIITKKGEKILCSWHARPLVDRHNRRIGAMAVGRDITEYKKMQEELQEYTKNLENNVKERTKELQQKVNQLAKLLEIGEEIRLNVDIDVILNKICEAVQALGWNKVVISLRDYETQSSRVVAAAGLESGQLEEVMSWGEVPFRHTERYIKNEFRISNSYFIDHTTNLIDKRAPYSLYTRLDERGKDEWHPLDALLVPIRTLDRILGIISVDDPKDRKKPSLNKIRDLEIFADKATLAIENAHLFQVHKENEKHAKFLAEISQIFHSSLRMNEVLDAIVNKGSKVIGEFCSLLLLDQQGEYLIPQASFHEKQELVDKYLKGCEEFPSRVGMGLIGTVVSTGNPVFISRPFSEEVSGFKKTLLYYVNQKFPISSLMVLPLHARDRIIGVMIFLNCQAKKKYRQEDLKLAKELADRAALAIENARLFKEAGEKAKELEKANRLKTEFLANVSHELRTPLNAIITLSDILIRGIPGKLNEEQVRQLQMIQRSGSNLLGLISDILDLSKIESGKVEPIYSEIPIRAVIEETVEHIRPLCVEKELALDFECDEDVPDVIYSDQEKLTKAVMNILSNAVKFTHKGGVKLAMSMAGPTNLKIEVSDTGIGIPKDRIDEIFKEFHQIDSSDSRTYGGTGLGLAITRRVLDIIGGSVSVESEVNKGSTFTLLIPFQFKRDTVTQKTVDSDRQMRRPPMPEPVKFDLTDDREQLDGDKKTILVVDDEREAIYIMRQYLHDHNYQIIFPRNGEDVAELARRFNPFAVTLDILMPEKSGWDILEILKSDPQTENIPVIITSILPEKERAFEMGAAEYLVKPFEPQKLLVFLATLESRGRKMKAVLDLPKIFNVKRLARKKLFPIGRKEVKPTDGKTRILLVDDDKDTKYAVQYVLEEAGYEVFLANEGKEALEQVKSIDPNLILMDMMMPGMNGYEATQKLKSDDKAKDIPIIAMTAKAMKGDREKIILAGCDDYIAKPFMTKEIVSLVEKWI
ncbi:PAS domain S-box protein [candidate division KSB1 bacterium]|nr:PAS domain S-box protein [candidate division KSB1 bacterium]NIR71042.1 PAS domain S-box protein [candidate division KSB1 bacterium]NIS24748.1 PAS domain S-box protein [candidate division KSB1 bacterium]NIT71653.1 PAS domain S-box protein [candidate division KSB1 bacterium]NIU25360.1 PAS domain S-box protein [candidate division KSB1 bacterium]